MLHTLQTVAGQNFQAYGDKSFEVIVSDNDSQDDICGVVRQFPEIPIRYVKTDQYLSMTDSWEFALAQAKGSYVGFLCTDDGYMLDTLSRVHAIVDRTDCQAVTFQHVYYYWPNHSDPDLRKKLLVPAFLFPEGVFSSTELIEQALSSLFYGKLPCFLNSFCRRDVVDAVRKKLGRIFRSFCPDVYSGFLMAAHIPSIYVCNQAMGIGGVSGGSTGGSFYHAPKGDIAQQHLSRTSGEQLSNSLIPYPFVTTLVLDSAFKALRDAGREPTFGEASIARYVIHCYAQVLQIHDRHEKRVARTAIKNYLFSRSPLFAIRIRVIMGWTRIKWAIRDCLSVSIIRRLQRWAYDPSRTSGGLQSTVVQNGQRGFEDVYQVAGFLAGRSGTT